MGYFLEGLMAVYATSGFIMFFALSLLFFVISAFWMFLPKTTIFKKGLYFTLAGVVVTIILMIV